MIDDPGNRPVKADKETVAHAMQLLVFNQLSVIIALGLAVYFYVGFVASPWLIAGSAWLVVFFVMIGVGRRVLTSTNTVRVGLGLLIGNWISALVITAVAPFSYPAGILQVIIPVIASAPVLGRRTLVRVVAAATVMTGVVCGIGLGLEDSALNDAVDEQIQDIVMIIGIPIMTIAIGIGAWDAHDRQRAALRRTLMHNAEIQESRQRLVAASDRERNRIERDLHDGAQQYLVAVAMQLRLLRSTADLPGDLDPLIDDLEAAMASLRELAHGIYPPLLRSAGLGEAISAAARRSPLTIDVDVVVPRYDPEVEAGLYFCCIEAIQNATKHAGPAANVSITISEVGHDIHGRICDDGPGLDVQRAATGTGVRNMEDRIVSLGGDFVIRGNDGTEVTFTVPVAGRHTQPM